MKKIFTLLISFLNIGFCYSQWIFQGMPVDSTITRFDSTSPAHYLPDTSAIPLWQIGRTHKTFFATDSSGSIGIMTDTQVVYPPLADNYFVFIVSDGWNPIVDIWHSYQTDSGHAGGVVEFSVDSGTTWQNVLGSCNIDFYSAPTGILTSSFYSANDTLFNGMPGFSGTATGRYSRLQLINNWPGWAAWGGCVPWHGLYYLRFRFISDNSTDSLAGWKIDSIRVEKDYWEGISTINKELTLSISPNPSTDGVFNFPEIENQDDYQIQITDQLGRVVQSGKYKRVVDLSAWPAGIYYYRATDGHTIYAGKVQRE